MKKVFIMLLSGILCVSCNTTRNTLSLSDLDGEWNIDEIKGLAIKANQDSPRPYIGFDTKQGIVYGYSGCNRFSSPINPKDKPGTIKFGHMAGTMMACPDMETEKNVLQALSTVEKYRKAENDGIALCNSSNRPVIILKRRFFPMNFSELKGDWNIVSVFGKALSGESEQTPYISFDTDGKKISGYSGCNRFFGNIEVIAEEPSAISIPPVGSTRMMCPDMETENSILEAIKSVKSFGRLDEKQIVMYTSSGTEALVLSKK